MSARKRVKKKIQSSYICSLALFLIIMGEADLETHAANKCSCQLEHVVRRIHETNTHTLREIWGATASNLVVLSLISG